MSTPAISTDLLPIPIDTVVKLSQHEITKNYYAGYQLALDIIRDSQNTDFVNAAWDMDYIELAQSVFGCERLVRLIQTERFDRELYERIIAEEVAALSKNLFPDVGKRHFVSIDKLRDEFSVDMEDHSQPEGGSEAVLQDDVLAYLQGRISSQNFDYLKKVFERQDAGEREFSWNDKIYRLIDQSVSYLENKIDHMRRLYPDGIAFTQDQIDVRTSLDEESVVGVYKNVFLGLFNKFPMHFLNHDTLYRCAVLTRYSTESILQKKPLDILKENTSDDFARVGLTGVVRYFNYSLNRMMRNAYPDLLMPWEQAHVEDGYWHEESNRRLAVRWLVEEKLKIPRNEIPKALRDDKIKKSTFVECGLSYMFMQYYKSVSRCIGFGYPELMPWELGSVPNSFWQGEEGSTNVVRSVMWMMKKMEIPIPAIPQRIKDKTICREAFKQYGLSTVFERIFKKNMFHLINTVYPGQFEIWEIGKTPVDHWDNLIHAYRAAQWVAKKEGVDEKKIAEALRSGKITKETFAKYNLASMLKNVFDNDLLKAYLPCILPKKQDVEAFMRELVLFSIVQRQIRDLEVPTRVKHLMRKMFFRPMIFGAAFNHARILKRLRKRIRRRMQEMVNLVDAK